MEKELEEEEYLIEIAAETVESMPTTIFFHLPTLGTKMTEEEFTHESDSDEQHATLGDTSTDSDQGTEYSESDSDSDEQHATLEDTSTDSDEVTKYSVAMMGPAILNSEIYIEETRYSVAMMGPAVLHPSMMESVEDSSDISEKDDSAESTEV